MSDLKAGNLSNLQLELLKLYADDVSEEDLRQIKQLIASYFAQINSHQRFQVPIGTLESLGH